MLGAFLEVHGNDSAVLLKGVNYVLVAGEAFPKELCEKYLELEISAKLENIYGPTEASVYASRYSLDQYAGEGPVLIGRPIDNTQIFIIDEKDQLVPIGVSGELCVSEDGLARGYLNRGELTAEKFVQNPFVVGERMYRTGDLARWQPDGNIEFLGRIDEQVKIRGFRIKLGEVESVLRAVEGIQEAVVLAKERKGAKALAAYYVSDGEIEASDIRERMGRTLPGYMVPTHYIKLEEIPLTANGKVDRKGLPEPDGSLSTAVAYVAPRNEVERELVQIWENIFDVRPIGIKDDFFDLGGHSIHSIILIHKIEKELGKKCDAAALFKAPTVEQLADVLRKGKSMDPNESFIHLQGGGSGPPLFLIHFLYHYKNLLQYMEDQPFGIINLR